MYSVEEIRDSLANNVIKGDLMDARQLLGAHRLQQDSALGSDVRQRLRFVVDAVLASAPGWPEEAGLDLVQRAAEVAELLVLTARKEERPRHRLRAALLYELAAFPMMASAMVTDSDGPAFLIDFFKRRQAFASLGSEIHLSDRPPDVSPSELLRTAACQQALDLIEYQQADQASLAVDPGALEEAARRLRLDLSLTEVRAFQEVVRRRAQRSTRLLTPSNLLGDLRAVGFPPEVWQAQAKALREGLLDHERDAWSLAAPTGTGKTFISRLLILDTLARQPGGKILYIVPSKALVYQVARDLTRSLAGKEIAVTAVTPQLVALDLGEDSETKAASVLVLTPEKADLLLRLGAEFLNQLALVIVDEAHHIEEGTRGVLLELYLARMLATLGSKIRYVLLSAVAPNIHELTEWIGKRPGGTIVEQRSTRMRVGIYRIRREGRYNIGAIDYTDGTRIRLFERGVKTGKRAGLVQLALELKTAGPLLVVARGKGSAETIAGELNTALKGAKADRELSREQLENPVMARLDSRLEREMHANVGLRSLVKQGIAYHHAGLPPRVREVVEEAIRENFVRCVVATTTLAEGVNFPFSTVVVESLATQAPTFEPGKPMSYRVFTPRKFWNIAGRAGRPGSDHEGQVILYEPSLSLERVGATIDPYIKPDLRDIPPVTSALADGVHTMFSATAAGELALEDLEEPELPERVPRPMQGVVNLLRVGLAHARATGYTGAADEYFARTYAASKLPESERAFAKRLIEQQEGVLERYLAEPDAPSVKLVAELGLSIDTLSRLQRYVRERSDAQLEALGRVLYGPRINFEALPYFLSAVLSRMAELEGRRLNGWYSSIVTDWCLGIPFSAIKSNNANQSLEDLISLVYSRIQYMLPWGLYAVDRFVTEEAERRHLRYAGQVNQLAYLVDAGVPDLAALRLTGAGFERADSSRLSRAYFDAQDGNNMTDILAWVRGQSDAKLMRIVQGPDRRRLDFDFFRLLADLRGSEETRATPGRDDS
jgi:superfamily II DNA/RNA helicase